jgi:hypothetical protein
MGQRNHPSSSIGLVLTGDPSRIPLPSVRVSRLGISAETELTKLLASLDQSAHAYRLARLTPAVCGKADATLAWATEWLRDTRDGLTGPSAEKVGRAPTSSGRTTRNSTAEP